MFRIIYYQGMFSDEIVLWLANEILGISDLLRWRENDMIPCNSSSFDVLTRKRRRSYDHRGQFGVGHRCYSVFMYIEQMCINDIRQVHSCPIINNFCSYWFVSDIVNWYLFGIYCKSCMREKDLLKLTLKNYSHETSSYWIHFRIVKTNKFRVFFICVIGHRIEYRWKRSICKHQCRHQKRHASRWLIFVIFVISVHVRMDVLLFTMTINLCNTYSYVFFHIW